MGRYKLSRWMEPVQMKDTLPADLWTVEVIIRCERENKQFGEDI